MTFKEELLLFESTAYNFGVLVSAVLVCVCIHLIKKNHPKLNFGLLLLIDYLAMAILFSDGRTLIGSMLLAISYFWVLGGIKAVRQDILKKEVQEAIEKEVVESTLSNRDCQVTGE